MTGKIHNPIISKASLVTHVQPTTMTNKQGTSSTHYSYDLMTTCI